MPVLTNKKGDNYVRTFGDPTYPRRGEPNTGGHELTIFQIGNLQLGEFVRLFILQLEVVINFILDMIAAVSLFIFRIISLLSPYLFVFILFIFLYWWAHVMFPFTMKAVVYIGIPIVNMLIIAINIIIKIVAFIYMILGTIWNAVVPFLGMLLMFIFDIIFAILDAINQILGTIDLGSLFQDLMPLINIIMELVLQIIQVIIQVGEPILNALLQIIVPLLEAVFSVIKVLLPIITFLVKVIFFVLQPIIWLLQAFFGGGQAETYGQEDSGSARRLLSMKNLFGNKKDSRYTGYDPYAQTLMTVLNMTPGELYTEIYKNTTEVVRDLWSTPQMTGRRPLEFNTRKAGLRFMDEEEEEEGEDEEVTLGSTKWRNLDNSKRSAHDDDLTYGFVHTFYRSSKSIPQQTTFEMFDINEKVMEHYRSTDPLTISAIYANHNQQNGYIKHDPKDRLGSVRYAAEIEHPNVLNERLKQERADKRAELYGSRLVGRKLLEMTVFPDDANAHLNHYMSNLEREHAMQVMDQAKLYKDKHEQRMVLASTVTGAISVTMKKHAETTFHPDNIRDQCNAFLQTMGYADIWDWHSKVVKEFADGETYFMSLVKYFDNPLFNFIRSVEIGEDDTLYFKDWQSETHRSDFIGEESANTGRRLFSVDEDNNLGTSNSRAALSGFATVSKKNCQTNPKHPLCVPIPPNSIFKFNIPLLILTQEQIDALLQDTSNCSPWISNVGCIFCPERIYNAAVEILFLFVAIPPVNYAIASITRILPWTGVFLDWMFIVPKFKRATTLQWLCFVKETYSLFITMLVFGLAYILLWPFIMAFVNAFKAILQIKARDIKSTGTVDKLDRFFRPLYESDRIEPPQPPFGGAMIQNRISNDQHIHYHNYGGEFEVQRLLDFIQKYSHASEARMNMRIERLLTYLGMYHYNLHVKHPDHIDTDASSQEERYLTHPNHPVQRLIEHKNQQP